VYFNKIPSCGSTTQNTPRTTSIDAPTNQQLQQVESCDQQDLESQFLKERAFFKVLKAVQRFKEQVDANLTSRGYISIGLKLPAKLQLLRQDITEKEESTKGEHGIDITKYFKLLLTSCPANYVGT
jgi:heme oxygenase